MKYRSIYSTLLFIIMLATLWACGNKNDKEKKEDIAPAIVLENMDTTVHPGEDFFQYVNGSWLKKVEIPADQGRWGSFNELIENNNDILLSILKEASKEGKYEKGSDQYKVAHFYEIGMDSALVEQTGTEPLDPFFKKIDAISNTEELQKVIAELHTYFIGAFYDFGVYPDLKNSKVMATYLGQGGLTMPDRDYYLKTDEKSEGIKKEYLTYIEDMFLLIGSSEKEASSYAKKIMEMETQMAKASMTRVELRDIPAQYNKMSIQKVQELAPSINWNSYFMDLGAPSIDTLIVTQPEFIKETDRIFKKYSPADWKVYLKWHVLHESAPFLSNKFVQAHFDFTGKTLNGLEKIKPRWKRVIGQVNTLMGEALGKLYVEKVFPPEAKEKALAMVENIKEAFGERIEDLDWMSDDTKKMALKKLGTLRVKIGYPDKWKDYSSLDVKKDSYLQNVIRASKFEFERELDKLGKPVDREEWHMNPQRVNAYYNPLFNEIVFPAAILQPPFYNYKADEAVNYGGIGAVIGHEITHGFDDNGSRFDAEGNMQNWWTDEDRTQFEEKTKKLITQYDEYIVLDSLPVNGKLTLGENIADLGGVAVAFDGLQRHLKKNGRPENIDGFTPEQRFFLSWGTIWRIKFRDEALRQRILTDTHSPGNFRANGPLSNTEAFFEAFSIAEGDPMRRNDLIKIW